jgi:DNA-binding transcriptional LysR family regulator
MVVVASPAYLAEHGKPKTPADLAGHNCLDFCFTRIVEGWPFLDRDGRTVTVAPLGNALVSDGESMRLLALSGLGLARLSRFHVTRDIKAGTLVPVLEEFNPGDEEPLHAIYVGQGGLLPARVRAFLDFPGGQCAAACVAMIRRSVISPSARTEPGGARRPDARASSRDIPTAAC